MTPEEFEQKIMELKEQCGGDEEIAHIKMDELILDLLKSLGYEKGVEIFNSQSMWYS